MYFHTFPKSTLFQLRANGEKWKRDRSLFLFLRVLSIFAVQLLKSLLLADGKKRDRSPTFH
ncbi:hypothetical protein H6F78_06380 [Coleofasciculus sp. FACHB-64]|uniref:hypothetical protein n=1 Tax=Cyanophyceae TaxID=3028117 RepID=UPI001685C505|nr:MULTISPECIES: hypothetical protein [unclassified Coleofasciculus]MBD1839448.1 hypothetical protein [Coleofasciculus sp. FACHB-501]MBD2045225.1 hypothetical protein [Coleofasciculus sp. FACHB-64]